MKAVIRELIEGQKQRLLKLAQKIKPGLTLDDLWQPNDFPELEFDPLFRYEEGVWHGMEAALVALEALEKQEKNLFT